MITDKKTEIILSGLDSFKHQFEAGLTPQVSVNGYGISERHGLSECIYTKFNGSVTEPLIITATYEIRHELLEHASFYKEKFSVPEIVLRAKYPHGLVVSWSAIKNLFLAFDKVTIDAKRLCLEGEISRKLVGTDSNGILDISSVSELTLKEFGQAQGTFKHIIYNPQSRSLGMLGVYFHQKLKDNGQTIHRLSNGKDMLVKKRQVSLSELGEIRTLAVLWDKTFEPLEIINTSNQPVHIPRIVLFGRDIEVEGAVSIGELVVAHGAEVECEFSNEVAIDSVNIEPYKLEGGISDVWVKFHFNANARIGRFGTLDNVFRESAGLTIKAAGQCKSVTVDEIYVSSDLVILPQAHHEVINFGTIFARGLLYLGILQSGVQIKNDVVNIKKATLTNSAVDLIDRHRIDELIVPYEDEPIEFKGVSVGNLVIDARDIDRSDIIPGIARDVRAEKVQILTDETTKRLIREDGWLYNSTVGELRIDDAVYSDEAAPTEQHRQQQDWIVKSKLMGIDFIDNKVAKVPPTITSLNLPDGLRFYSQSILENCELRILSINSGGNNLLVVAGCLRGTARNKVKILELRQSKDLENILSGNNKEELLKIIESGAVSRLVIWDKAQLTREFMYKVRDSQCEVIFKQVIGSVPNVAWREGSRGRVVCEKIIGDLADVLVCANKASRKGIIEQSNAIIINARAGKQIDIDQVLEKAKVAVNNREVYVVVRGKNEGETQINSPIALKGIVIEPECKTSLSVVTEHGEGIGKIISYGITNKISGKAQIGEIILSKHYEKGFIYIHGQLNIGKLTSFFEHNPIVGLQLGFKSSVMQIGEVSEFTSVKIYGKVDIGVVKNVKELRHADGELNVQRAERVTDCSGLGEKTYIKELVCGEKEHMKWTTTRTLSRFRADSIRVTSGYRFQLVSYGEIFATKLVVEGDIKNLEFMVLAKYIEKVIINGNVQKIHSNFNEWIDGRLFVKGIICRLGSANPWITESGHFKQCENKGFLYWQGIGEEVSTHDNEV